MATILVVEDCPVVGDLLAMTLQGAGHSVLTAVTGLQGLAMLASTRPSLMLLDLHLPELNGLDVLKAVKSHQLRPDLPVLMLTGDDDDWSLAEAHRLGASGYLRKPFDTERLLDRIDSVLRSGDLVWTDDQHTVKRRPAASLRAGRIG